MNASNKWTIKFICTSMRRFFVCVLEDIEDSKKGISKLSDLYLVLFEFTNSCWSDVAKKNVWTQKKSMNIQMQVDLLLKSKFKGNNGCRTKVEGLLSL